VDARDKQVIADHMHTLYNPSHPEAAALGEQAKQLDDALVAHQRALAKPYPYHFEIQVAKEPSK
jgi:hypothetical protein